MKLRPDAEELKAIGPEFTKRWEEYFANAPDKPIMYIGTLAVYVFLCVYSALPTHGVCRLVGDMSLVPDRKYFTFTYFVEYPASIGHIHISSDDVYADPDFDPAFLTK